MNQRPLYLPHTTLLSLSLSLTPFSARSGASLGAGTGRLEYRFGVEITVPGYGSEDGTRGLGESEEAKSGVGDADCEFVCWLVVALCSPSAGLLWDSDEDPEWVQASICRSVSGLFLDFSSFFFPVFWGFCVFFRCFPPLFLSLSARSFSLSADLCLGHC